MYQNIREIDPENPDARARLIDLNLRLGQEEAAALILDEHLEHLVKSGQEPVPLRGDRLGIEVVIEEANGDEYQSPAHLAGVSRTA